MAPTRPALRAVHPPPAGEGLRMSRAYASCIPSMLRTGRHIRPFSFRDMTTVSTITGSTPTALLEKFPLERYVAPDKPSLVGLSRAGLAEALGRAGVAERERRMRVQQLWHWIYFRGVQDFDAMTSVAKPLRAMLAGQ